MSKNLIPSNVNNSSFKDASESIPNSSSSIPGISYNLGSMILAEIVDISRFDLPAKLLAFAGLDPSTYQSGKFLSTHSVMVKRDSKYLRYALIQAARIIYPTFNSFKEKKLAEGKHFMVVMGHVTKKLVRVIYYLLKNNAVYQADKAA